MSVVVTGSAKRLSRIATVLAEGERLAARTCESQARIAVAHGPLARALNAQARQEREHAALVGALVLYAGEDRPGADAALHELHELDARLAKDLHAGHLADTLFGMQGVLDQLGAVLIERLANARHPAARCFAPATRRILAQEHGHVMLGEKWFRELGARPSYALDAYRGIGARLAQRVGELSTDCASFGDTAWAATALRLEGWGM